MGFMKTMLWPFFQGETKAPVAPKPTPPPARPAEIAGVPVPGLTRSPTPEDFGPPPFPPLVSNAEREKVFGIVAYEADPVEGNPEHIRITNGFRHNIIFVHIPQMKGLPGAEIGHVDNVEVPGMSFHRLGAQQLQGMWSDWEKAGLLKHIKNFDGSFSPRFVRGSNHTLSNHCYGSAFDINYNWNTLGAEPAEMGHMGSVRELVPIASHWGFYWGGFYHGRKDGMHFEVAKVMT
jgi:D-alanyl-D-alanine carboxypeptidase-like protein